MLLDALSISKFNLVLKSHVQKNNGNYLNPLLLLVELPGDDDDVVTVTTDDDLDDVEVLWTSTNPVLFTLLEFGRNEDEFCFKNSHKSPPTNPSPGNTHSLTTQTGSPWLHAAKTRETFG